METVIADIAVCGAGTSGLAAAVSAARMGKNVVMLEKTANFGGAPVNHFIQSFSGGPLQGIGRELSDLMKALNPEYGKYNNFRAADYVLAWQQLMVDLPIRILTGQAISAVKKDSAGRICAVTTNNYEVEAGVFLDCTGDAVLAHLAGCKSFMGREARSAYNEPFAPINADNIVQQCTLLYTVVREVPGAGVERAAWAEFNEDEFLIWGPSVPVKNPLDEIELNAANLSAREQLIKEGREWREKGFRISAIAPAIGVRETRRIAGNYLLTARDMLNKKTFSDSIGVFYYTIDPWEPEGNPFHDLDKRETCELPPFEIPYASLITDTVPNLIVAGRCISATHIANSALRVMPIVLITGQAAGIAAAIAVESTDCRTVSIDTARLRDTLRASGVAVSLSEAAA